MIILKRGYNHTEDGSNCQDFVTDFGNIKLVLDGCSQSPHSEVGAKLFARFYNRRQSIFDTFQTLTNLFTDSKDIFNYLLFTVLVLKETETTFDVDICGDGYIIAQDYKDNIDFIKFDFGSAPPYFAYNYVDPKILTDYQDGVLIECHSFKKSDYKAVGIASDGIRYIVDSFYRNEFEDYLIKRNVAAIKRLINRQHLDFKDDISIAI
jgi:hypothetical protein